MPEPSRPDAGLTAVQSLNSILDSATDFAIFATDEAGNLTLFSFGAQSLLGYGPQAVVGHHTPLLFHDPDELRGRELELSAELGAPICGFEVLIQQARKGLSERKTWTFVLQDGQRVPVSLAVNPLRDPGGVPSGYLFIARDIRGEVASRHRIIEAIEAAEDANRSKGVFLANMSHEIRTPMNGVLGIAQLLLETPLEPKQRDYVNMIQTAGRSLLQIINDILDFSKIEAGKLEIAPAPFSPEQMVSAVTGILSLKAEEKGLKLVVNLPKDLPSLAMGDALRLQQVLFNLLGNAIKFTAKGEIGVAVRRVGAEAPLPSWEFQVRDTGVGLTPDQLERLFQPFEQAERSTTRQFGGTGLGLSIAKRLVGLMGGEIGVTSEPGVGSVFWFRVPLEPLAAPAVAPATMVTALGRLDGWKILLVEDAPINQVVARTLLRNLGAEVDVAADGQLCLDALAANPGKYHVILMDVQMPVMNGYEATLAIRDDLELELPIIALTAGVMDEEREKCLAIGMNGIVAKPIEKELLYQTLKTLVEIP